MKIIILGAGQVGSALAQNLVKEHDITIVDNDAEALNRLLNRLDVRTLQGHATNPDILKDAGARDADLLIAVTSNDECNIVTCQIAYCLFNVPTRIARVRNKALNKNTELFSLDNIPIDLIIDPAKLITQHLAEKIRNPGAHTVINFDKYKFKIFSLKVENAARTVVMIGKKLKDLYQDLANIEVSILGVLRKGNMLFATDIVIETNDEIYFATKDEHSTQVITTLLEKEIKYRRIMIAGGGHIGTMLAAELEDECQIKILEHSKERCEEIAKTLHNTIVLNADASDVEGLQNENISETDLFCSLTNDDEVNIMAAILAKRFGAKYSISLVNKQTYAHYLIESSPDIDMGLSPQHITESHILKYLYRGDMLNVYPLNNCNAEVIEIRVHGTEKTSDIINVPISKISWPPDTLVCAVIRNNTPHMTQDITLQDQDCVILLLGDKTYVHDIVDLFKVSAEYL